MEAWHDFFVAEAGAAAALAGLLFVAVSINLARILQFAHLPVRTVEALACFLAVLVVASVGLVPDQSPEAHGVEIAAAGAALWLTQTVGYLRTRAAYRPYQGRLTRALANQVPPLPFVVGGGLLACGHPVGASLLLPGTLLCFASGVFSAWVLLIEIQR